MVAKMLHQPTLPWRTHPNTVPGLPPPVSHTETDTESSRGQTERHPTSTTLAVFIFRLYTPTVIGRAIKITPDRGDRARTDDGYILRYSRQVICVVSVPLQSGPG